MANVIGTGEALRVAVVGAGISGLACARALKVAGCEVTVFDKSRAPGGRLSTRRGEGWQCDHGAQYFTARDPAFRSEVARWQRARIVSRWAPQLAAIEGGHVELRPSSLERFVGQPRMSSITRHLARGLDLRVGTRVSMISGEAGHWRLHDAHGGKLAEHFGAVVVALPAPQARALLPGQARWLRELTASVSMQPCWALMLGFDARLALPYDAAFVSGGPLSWIARDASKPGREGREMWLLHASAAWSAEHLDAEPYDVATVLAAAFAELGAPPPQSWSAHLWRYAEAAEASLRGCAWHGDLRLGLCGDWLDGNRIEGAWLSGNALARRICHSLETVT